MHSTPLKRARIARKWCLDDVTERLHRLEVQLDSGNLSRIENGKQQPKLSLAASLVLVFEGELSELHILYPERYPEPLQEAADTSDQHQAGAEQSTA